MNVRWRRRIFWTLFGGYAAYYLCRVNLSIAQPGIGAEHGWTKAEVGSIASWYYLVYALGKLVNGVLADRLGGRLLFVLGILGSAAANIAFPFAGTLPALSALWSVNAFFQSMGWGALVTIMSRWYGPTEQGTAMGLLSTNYQLGHAVSWGILGLLAAVLPWSGLFSVPAFAFAGIGIACYFLLRNDPREVGLPSPHPELAGVRRASPERSVGRAVVRRLLSRPYFWTVCAISFLLTFIRYTFVTWGPTYLHEQGAGISSSAFQAAVFPLIGSAGSILAGWYSDRFSRSRRAPVLTLGCGGLTIALGVFAFSADLSAAANVLLFAVAGLTLYAPYSLLAGAIAIDLGSRHAAATAAGIIDGVGYVGASLSGALMGKAIDDLGWPAGFLLLGGAALCCVVLGIGMGRLRTSAGDETEGGAAEGGRGP